MIHTTNFYIQPLWNEIHLAYGTSLWPPGPAPPRCAAAAGPDLLNITGWAGNGERSSKAEGRRRTGSS